MLSKHYKIEFFFGVGLTQDREPIDTEIVGRSLQIIKGVTNKMFGGCTLTETIGSWTDPDDGYIYKEPSRLLFVVTPADPGDPAGFIPPHLLEKIEEIKSLIKEQLNQKSLVVIVSAVLCEF